MDKTLVTIFGTLLIGFIYWFFLMKRGKAVEVSDGLEIEVEGGYIPEVVSIRKGRPVTLTFLRTDPSSCLEEVVIPDFHTRRTLPLGQKVAIKLKPETVGEFPFSCGMGMYHGKIIVTEQYGRKY